MVVKTPNVPTIEWDELLGKLTPRSDGTGWQQGQHIALIGPTGSGKTTCALSLLPLRKYIIVFGTKPYDTTLDEFGQRNHFVTLPAWERRDPEKFPRRIIWPRNKDLVNMVKLQQKVFTEAMNEIYSAGRWCVYLDELYWASKMLGLDLHIKTYLTQARSLDISLVTSVQRPAWVPLEVYSQSTHFFIWRANDRRDLNRLAEISAGYSGEIEALQNIVSTLPQYQFLYLNTRENLIYKCTAPPPKGGKK